ncbi:capsule assembly Wzi family protein [Emticicia soli]|uniref:Capsule assembly Wzi family protein n=1 Tax=Emticicia soli TaxID=2027878 RepID=A0ABW5J412_9BACT
MIKIFRPFLVLLFCLNSYINVYAQNNILSDIKYQVGTGAYVSGKTPFWMRANQYGIVPQQGPFFTLQGGVYREYDSTKRDFKQIKKFDIGYGASVVVNAAKQSQLLLPEVYAKIRYGAFEFYAGRRKEIIGLTDTLLNPGSYIWSGNALPLPKVQISIPNYTSIIGKGLISIKGAYAHGWFGNQAYTDGYYLHQKWLYGKVGRDSWKFNFYGGINHQVQWGGYAEAQKDNTFSTKNGYFSADPFVYLNVVLPIAWRIPNDGTYTDFETQNRFGNHLGSVDFGVSMKTAFANISFYRQIPYEDGQMPEVILSMDGNYSLNFDLKEKKQLHQISFGYLDTRRQAGELTKFARWVGKKETHFGEFQNYFNHGQYIEGWSYQGNGIGTPLIIPNKDLKENAQFFPDRIFTVDNRVQAYSIAATGKLGNYGYLFKSSLITSLGTPSFVREKSLKQFSSLLALNIPLEKLKLDSKINIAFDSGELYGNNIGISFFIVKKW